MRNLILTLKVQCFYSIALMLMTATINPVSSAESLMEIHDRDGNKFQTEYLTQDGVESTKSGLMYKINRKGDSNGKTPGPRSKVTVHYEGRHINGKVFDSSYERSKPIDFPLNRVIKGWTEGLQLMKEGAKYQFVIPPDIAYGHRGAGGSIGPNETLIFDIELIKVH